MSSFLTRVLGRSSERRSQHITTPEELSSHRNKPIFHQIDRKIHPNLSSLLEQERSKVNSDSDVLPKDTAWTEASTNPQFVSLTSSSRRRAKDASAPSAAPLDETDSVQEVTKKPDHSLTSSKSSSASGRNLSGETFGQRNTSGRHLSKRTSSKTLTTPSSEFSQNTENEMQRGSQRSTPSSSSDLSQRGRSRGNTVSSRNTFGVPSPRFMLHRRPPASNDGHPPPMPPLDHPAFKSTSSNSRAFHTNELGSLRVTRHSHSLPSMSHQSRALADKSIRKRSRTQSGSKPLEHFSEANYTPISHPKTHKRSQSNASQSSSRRASAEFSAEQASSVSHGSEFLGSWEAQVSREMVRRSLGVKQARPRNGEIAELTVSKSGQARGNHVGAFGLSHPSFVFHSHLSLLSLSFSLLVWRFRTRLQSFRTPALGSPFLFQHAHTHNIPPATRSNNNTLAPLYLVTSGISNRTLNIFAMPKSTSRPSQGTRSSPEHTPSPPPKINTVPYPVPPVPSSSLLAPPSLSFTAATPEASPISPIPRPPGQQSSTEPLVSALRVPATPPAVRPTSSHKGKRKADEAGVEGGGTPPKETKEPRATFAVDPRPHRASANSNSTRSAPSSYHRKRARLSTTPESRPGSQASGEVQNAATTGSWSSKNSGYAASQQHDPRLPMPTHQPPQRAPSRRSLSQASIPMSAVISPHVPSVARSSTFHMRDPRKPGPIQSTPWSLSFPSGRAEPKEGWRGWAERGGSPLHAWLFFLGFLLFPLWWIASFTGIPTTRRLDGGEQEKGVILDDPQVEHDAKAWRFRCRVMAVISILTYIPFIVLVAIFA